LDLVTTNEDPRDVAVNIVRYLMTFLGIIAVVIILWGGFKWMTAAGNEDKVASAKKIIAAGAIGLVVILAAFAIVTFVINTTGGLLANGTM
ncbi:pilin, partial [bacterium]|nr:pilin [bacterium]